MPKTLIAVLVAIVLTLAFAPMAFAQEPPLPTPGDSRPLIAELAPITPPASDDGFNRWWLILPLLLIAVIVLLLLSRNRGARHHDDDTPEHPEHPEPGGGNSHRDVRTVRVERPNADDRRPDDRPAAHMVRVEEPLTGWDGRIQEEPATRVTATTTMVTTEPAAQTTPAPEAGTGGAPRTATTLLLIILLSAASAFAQGMPQATMITSVSPNIVLSGKTTKVNVTCNAACLPSEVEIGKAVYPGTGAGIKGANIQKTNNGFSMDVTTTAVKADGWTRWALKLDATWMLVPGDKSIYAMANVVDARIKDEVKVGGAATLTLANGMMDDKVKAALKNVPSRRTISTMITTEVKTLETRLDQKFDQKVNVVRQNAADAVTNARGDLQDQINTLVDRIDKLTTEVNKLNTNTTDMSSRNATNEALLAQLKLAVRALAEADLAATDKGFIFRGKLHKDGSDERTAIEAIVTALGGTVTKKN